MIPNIRYLLNQGRDHPRTIGDLAEALNVPRRAIEEAVQLARLDGVPIVSGSEGLWIAQTPHEARQAALALRRRALTQLETAAALTRAADELDGVPLTLGLAV